MIRKRFYTITALLALAMLSGMTVIAISTTNLVLFTAECVTWNIICYLVAKEFLK